MPTYDYACSKCEHTFERILKILDRESPTKEACPNCGKGKSVSISIAAPSLVSPFRVDGLKKPPTQFRERMQQIKKTSGRGNTIKDF